LRALFDYQRSGTTGALAGDATLAERKNKTYGGPEELSTGISPLDDEVARLLEVLRQNATHYFRGTDAHTGITVRKGGLQHGYCLCHLGKSERFHRPNPHSW
jgi:hypothetical protein